MLTTELDYHLPPDRIATHPASPRDSAKLLVVHRSTSQLRHHHVRDLPTILTQSRPTDCPGDLIVVNQSKVLPARFSATRTRTGGHLTGLYLNSPSSNQWQLMLESRGRLTEGEKITLTDNAHLTLTEKQSHGQWLATLTSDTPTLTLLQTIGRPPLPPYILKERKHHHESIDAPDDPDRYNTIYASTPGSVAAPTAGLHFTDQLLANLADAQCSLAKVTLHVGLGTFAPVRTETLEDHPMHSEHMTVPAETLDMIKKARKENRRIIPVGTTTVRTLESLPQNWSDLTDDYTSDTNLFITPATDNRLAFNFRFTDIMMTNFHLPQSTLLALVAALPDANLAKLKAWYQAAIENHYRFYSYGDAMLLL